MNPQDIQNILAFLNRCQLQGSEAEELVRLKQLLVTFGNKVINDLKPEVADGEGA